jgi:hypothetical protein
MSDYGVAHCIATKQYWVATWKVIDSRLPLVERKPLKGSTTSSTSRSGISSGKSSARSCGTSAPTSATKPR